MKKGLMLFHNNMEDVEALATKALLKRANVNVETVSISAEKAVKFYYGTEVKADFLASETDIDDYQFIIIPGGMYVSEVIEKDTKIKSLISGFHNGGKGVFAICAAPMFLGELGILKNKEYTIFPSCEKDSFEGILKQDKKVVRAANIITARSVGAVFEFVGEIINYLFDQKAVEMFYKNTYF
ncbi:MAG: DJ-1/PfpI family protein [Acholeplasmataceae bacterium]|nr:DJ-1/PfpI family protein [Acholeplasmataceae bacterium]